MSSHKGEIDADIDNDIDNEAARSHVSGNANGTLAAVRAEDDAHVGVRKVEAAHKVYGRYSRWFLFIGLGLASYIYSLDGTTTSTYLTFAASEFDRHALIASIQVAQSTIIAVGKPVIAKIADVSSRGTAYLIVLVFYVLGYIVIASAKNVGTIAGGIILYAIGYTGLQLLTQIIIADTTTLKWRGLVSALVSAPFLVNAFVGSNISSSVLLHAGWRWGYGMFALLVPAALAPLVLTLLWAEARAKRLGLVTAYRRANPGKASAGLIARVRDAAAQLDVVGLVLLGASVALILLPLALAETARGQWRNGSMIAMLAVGLALLPAFAAYDLRAAPRPVVAPRFVRNRTVVGAALIGFFDFFSFYLTFTYLFTFVLIVKPWSLVNATYFIQTQTVALTFFGICAGAGMRVSRAYKPVLVAGLCVRLLGVGLMIHSRGASAPTAELVWTQVLQGLGGGLAAVASQVGAQASVPHADVAIVTAVVLLLTEIGGAVGGAVAGAIWSGTMPRNLEKFLPGVGEAERERLFGSIEAVAAIPRGDPTREGVINAYDATMRVMVIAATGVAVVPVLVALGMPGWYLGDRQNAVDGVDLAGERAEGEEVDGDVRRG